ncbi:formylglycine-generating enzyme family protein [Aquimarina brevivitae]|uniref:Formylglycine-generating enzyme required for sulfatase activity n=1 Tax=Aquimarina brevivitae TaxID=323412 RepID=A0A4Q7NXC3_9FLAO|nr:formylglycine-generating enzyme family protein [Aquimarina brevivitae]RZS91874.1 formylglycine-generating enzyme required for sulfatase activity [Aquimarina brevivitae]
MNKILFPILVLFPLSVLTILSCKNKPTSSDPLQKNTTLYCYVPSDSLLGKVYLENKFLKNIAAITPNINKLQDTTEMVFIEGGVFEMGGDIPEYAEQMPRTGLPQPDEFPKHTVQVDNFYMDEHEVTVGQFLEFVKETGYKTVAEQDINWEELKKQVPSGTPKPHDSLLRAGALVFQYVPENTPKDDLSNWWYFKAGANWKNPSGVAIPLDVILNMPVTQISWYDAMAYAKWANKRLPTEAEYEYAMRAGAANTMYPWGDSLVSDVTAYGNFLQGNFPYTNTGQDGYIGTAPVGSFPPNAYGLYDIAGNVWEWTLDWYGADYYKHISQNTQLSYNPKGPTKTTEVYQQQATNKVVRGGSFLCNDSWCSGYRNARRMRLSPDSGMQHVGFRCVRSVPKNQ